AWQGLLPRRPVDQTRQDPQSVNNLSPRSRSNCGALTTGQISCVPKSGCVVRMPSYHCRGRVGMTKSDLMTGVQTGTTIWHHSVQAPDGRTVDLALFKGQMVYPNGEIGTYAGVEIIDMAEGKDTGQVMVLLEDGSVSNQTVRGEVTFTESAARLGGTGRWQIVSGTGRFAELRGGGSYTWEVDGEKWRAEFS